MKIQLPEAIETFFATGNSGDASRLPACLAADALVHDEHEEHRGLEAIGAWLQATRTRYGFHARPLSVTRLDSTVEVMATVEGDFPGSPARLTYTFVLEGDRIASLKIG